jgi:hypothetical protein
LIRRSLPLALLCCALGPPAAQAADPIMPLAEVRAGMSCTGLSVIRGVEISSFGVEVLDVIADDPAAGGARILVRVSGPAVDATGVGPGFSGSPILCDGRTAGAISEGIGEFGNKVVLATPIESILTARPARAPASARRAPALLAAASPLSGPLTVSGLSAVSRRLLSTVARRAGLTVLAAPPGPLGGYPPQDLRPGAAVGASLSTGDISAGAVGTVVYRDGADVYAFGHALDAFGRRSLFLHDSYVFGVIGNPVGVPDLGAMTYKLASPGGHPLGAITNDTFSAIFGTIGAEPPSIPLHVSARERGGARTTLDLRLADERALGLGAGMSFLAPLAASTAIDRLLGSFELVTMRLCTRIDVGQLRRPIGFCNSYFDGFSALTDVAEATSLVESFDLAPLDIERARVSLSLERGVVDEVIVGARAPRRVRRGRPITVRVSLRRRGGGARTVGVRVPVPRDVRPGRRTLVIEGNGFPADEEELIIELLAALTRGDGRRAADPRAQASAEPRSARQLARQVAALQRPLGLTARFRGREPRIVLRSDAIRFEGRARLPVRVVRR